MSDEESTFAADLDAIMSVGEPSDIELDEARRLLNQQRYNTGGLAYSNMERSKNVANMRIRVLALIRSGATPEEAMSDIGRSIPTFYRWRDQSSKFNEAVTQAKAFAERLQATNAITIDPEKTEFDPIIPANYETRTDYWIAFRKAYFNFDTFDHQRQLFEAIENAPGGGVTMIQMPPEWTKSSCMNDIMVAELCADPDQRFAYIGENQAFARKQMGRLQRRLEWDGVGQVPALYAHFGPFQPKATDRSKKWNADEITLSNSHHDEADPSVITVGITGQIRGARWDWVICDDIQSLKTKGDTLRLLNIIQGDVITRPGKEGKLIFVCNRVCRGDVYEEMDRIPGFIDEFVCIPAYDLARPVGEQSNFPRQWRDPETKKIPITDERGVQMGWDDADLEQRRAKVGKDQWSRVYMMSPETAHTSMVSIQEIQDATDVGRLVGAVPDAGVATIASLDPALTGHAAFTYCAYNASQLLVMDVIDIDAPGTNRRLYQEIEKGTQRYHPDMWVIESNTLQSGYLTDDAFLEMQSRHGFRASGHHTGGYNKADPLLGIPAMMEAICNGVIRFPDITRAPLDRQADFARLYDQLQSWRSDIPTRRLVQDMVTSLWFSYLKWRNLRAAFEQDQDSWKRDGLDAITMYSPTQNSFARR